MVKVNAKLLLTKSCSGRTEGLCLMMTKVSLRHMLEVILDAIVWELLEFGARGGSRVSRSADSKGN